MGRHGRRALAGTVAIALAFGAAACGGDDNDSDSASSGSTSAAGEPAKGALPTRPVEGRPAPARRADEKTRIAMIGFANNPYWVAVQQGADAANSVLADYNGEVDWIVGGSTIDVPTVNAALNAASSQGYDGVGFFIAGDGNCPTVRALTAKGMAVGAYNTLFDCVEESGGVINYAQEQYEAGIASARELIEAQGDRGGTVGIIVSQFTAPGSEQRRRGFIDGLRGSNLEVVGEGVEAVDSAGRTFNAARDYITANPDLVAIYATAGGPFGAAQAVAAARKQDQIKVIGYDFTPENIRAIRDGSMYGVTGQDEFGQGYNVAMALFNKAVADEDQDPVMQPAISPFMTRENVDQLDPAEQPVGTVPGDS
jgi:ribose transport system substrate-binding protein